jgi:SAM-dependent methyltransferase
MTLTKQDWVSRWEAQQGRSSGTLREQRFTALVEAVTALGVPAPLVLDLGCGPGSVANRILARLPEAVVVGIDADPVLLELGRRSHPDGRVRFIDADLTDPAWTEQIPERPYDAVTSTTALHWLTKGQLGRLYRDVAGLLRPGGLFLNGDVLPLGTGKARLSTMATSIRQSGAKADAETWSEWWEAIEADPSFDAEFAERRRRGHGHPDHAHVSCPEHLAALVLGGFSEVGTLWQAGDSWLVAAIR